MNQKEVNKKNTEQAAKKDPQEPSAAGLNRIKKVIAVMSGKGGVGKSTVTGLLAVSLKRQGYSVGIMDADITGPSIPRMFGVNKRPENIGFGLMPAESSTGIRIMSLNLLLENEDDPVIWRGPLIGNAIQQFWNDVVWGDLDYLLVDLPPGTSDAPLTVMQSLPLDGIIVVSSPQELVGMVVKKAVKMANMMNLSVIGLVENYSYTICPKCGEKMEIFGKSRGEEGAKEAKVPYLGSLPIDHKLAKFCDEGRIEEYESSETKGMNSWVN